MSDSSERDAAILRAIVAEAIAVRRAEAQFGRRLSEAERGAIGDAVSERFPIPDPVTIRADRSSAG